MARILPFLVMHSNEASPRLRVVHESSDRAFPALRQDEWASAFPWLIQGITTSGKAWPGFEDGAFDLGLFSDGSPEEDVRINWRTLADALGVTSLVHASQPHGCVVRVWPPGDGEPGSSDVPHLVSACDGHATCMPGVVLAVTVADCVPAYLVDPAQRAVAMVHAGWRGAAAGILETALDTMADRFGTRVDDVELHLGPAICGECYEVGPEVHEALEQPAPSRPVPIDLRGILGWRAVGRGVRRDRVTISGHCTRCGDAGFFSHRGGDAQRQVGFLGIRS